MDDGPRFSLATRRPSLSVTTPSPTLSRVLEASVYGPMGVTESAYRSGANTEVGSKKAGHGRKIAGCGAVFDWPFCSSHGLPLSVPTLSLTTC